MSMRKIHQLLGLVLLLPFIGWIVTGIVFLTKPGYEGAYQKVAVRTYPLDRPFALTPGKDWQEVKLLQSVLGHHLLIKKENGWVHLDPASLQAIPKPGDKVLIKLLQDAIAFNPGRYGHILGRDGDVFQTSTGVELQLDWNSLKIKQQGLDTKTIRTLYRIHYLEWFPHPPANLVLGIVALLSLFALVLYGVILYWRGRNTDNQTLPSD